MEISTANTAWFLFWASYWTFGLILTGLSHYQGRRVVTKFKEVCVRVSLNMLWTWFATNIIFGLPHSLRIFQDYNVAFKIVLSLLITEIWFYHVHLMMHHPQLYPRFHKLHHLFTQPYALTAMYATAYEGVLCNMMAVGIGPVLTSMETPYLYIWFVLVAFNATFTHSGYRWIINDVAIIDGLHDLHHAKFKYNYGTLQLFDRLYGTHRPL